MGSGNLFSIRIPIWNGGGRGLVFLVYTRGIILKYRDNSITIAGRRIPIAPSSSKILKKIPDNRSVICVCSKNLIYKHR